MSRWNPLRRFFGRDAPEPETAPAPVAPAPEPEPDGGWRRTAPMRGVLQRDSGEVIRPERFRASVASFRDHGVTSGGLGHRLSGEAPSGVMRGLARAGGRPVQRSDGEEFTWVRPEAESTSDSDSPVPRSGRRAVQRSAGRIFGRGRGAARAAASGGGPVGGAGAGSRSGGSAHPSGSSSRAGGAAGAAGSSSTAGSPGSAGSSGSARAAGAAGSSGSGPSGRAGPPSTAAASSTPGSSGTAASSAASSSAASDSTTSGSTSSAGERSPGAGSTAPAGGSGGGSPGSAAVQRVALRRLTPPLTRARPIIRSTPRRLPAITAPGPDVDLVLQRRTDADAPPARSDAPRPTAPSSPASPADSATAPSTAGTGGTGSTAPGGPPGTRPTLGADRSPEQPGLGGPVQRMPSGAVPLHHESTGSPEPPPPVQRAAEPAPEQQPERPSRAGRDRKRPPTSNPEVQRSTPNSRGGLGEPLGRLPESATPLRPGGTPPASGPVRPGGAAEAAPLLGDTPQVQRTPSTRAEPQATTPDDPAPADPVATPLAGSSSEAAGTDPATPVQRSRIQDAAGAPPHGGGDHGTAPLLGDTTIQRSGSGTPALPAEAPGHSPSPELPTAQRNPAARSSTGARQQPRSAPQHSPGPASQHSPGPATQRSSTAPHRAATPVQRSSRTTAPEAAAPHGTTPVQRLTAPSGADAPETPLAGNAPTGPHEVATGTHSLQRARPDSPDEPDLVHRPHHDPTHLSAPVQRARPLLTTRPLTTRTRLDQPRPNATAPPAEHRAVAPLRWTRREPGDRPADPAPVQRSATSAALPAVPAEPLPPGSAAAEPAPAPPGSAAAEPGARRPVRTARPVQRRTAPESPPAARSAPPQDEPTPQVPGVPPGVPVTVVPKQHEESTDREPPTGTGGEQDIDELARRLIEPVGRLLRTELRHGRERFGRTYDRRR